MLCECLCLCFQWGMHVAEAQDSFEFLAFSSDVSHWRHKQELVGVSVRYACYFSSALYDTDIVLIPELCVCQSVEFCMDKLTTLP